MTKYPLGFSKEDISDSEAMLEEVRSSGASRARRSKFFKGLRRRSDWTAEVYEHGVHVHLDNCSINITRTEMGVEVDIWEKGFEGAERVAGTDALDSELAPKENEA